jgi:hypothetical protein
MMSRTVPHQIGRVRRTAWIAVNINRQQALSSPCSDAFANSIWTTYQHDD